MEWKLTEAKNRLGEVLTRADAGAPQVIVRRGRKYVLMSSSDYDQRTGKNLSLKDLLLSGPSLEQVDLARDRRPGRSASL